MSRLNLNSIISWVDSHIIDYPRAMNLNYNIILLMLICFVSFFFLLIISPVLGMLWLLLPTVYFLYNKNYKNIFIVWGFLFFSWYFIFTACMFGFDEPILVRPDFLGCGIKCEETVRIFFYVTDKYLYLFSPYSFYKSILGDFCLQTLLIMGWLSSKLGFPIYIPSLFKGSLTLFKLIFGGKGSSAECSPRKDSEKSSSSFFNGLKTYIWPNKAKDFSSPSPSPYPSPYPSPKSKWENLRTTFVRDKSSEIARQARADDQCLKLAKMLHKVDKKAINIVKTDSCVVKGEYITVVDAHNRYFLNDMVGSGWMCMKREATKKEMRDAQILRGFDKNF